MTATPTVQCLLDTARQIARQAGGVLRAKRGEQRRVEYKGGIDLVTDADRASEELILRLIASHFPGHAVLAEERGRIDGSGACRWIVDPLDGTTNYAHGVPHYCVSIAVEDPLGLAAAAVYDPVRDELFDAGRGLGARLNGEPIALSGEETLGRALVGTGFPYDVWSRPELPVALFDAFVRKAQGVRRAGSAALDLCYVAAGRYDGFFELGLKPWDIAAGAPLVVEAGGRVTDLAGAPLDLAAGNVAAANPALHALIVELCGQVQAGLASPA